MVQSKSIWAPAFWIAMSRLSNNPASKWNSEARARANSRFKSTSAEISIPISWALRSHSPLIAPQPTMIAEKLLGMLYLFHNPADTGQYFARHAECQSLRFGPIRRKCGGVRPPPMNDEFSKVSYLLLSEGWKFEACNA